MVGQPIKEHRGRARNHRAEVGRRCHPRAGRYLRGMTERHRTGVLRLDRSIRALLADGENRTAETSSPRHAGKQSTPYMPSTN